MAELSNNGWEKASSAMFDHMVAAQKRLIRGMEVLTSELDTEVGATETEEVFRVGKVRLMRFKPVLPESKLNSVPVLIVYALINRPYMMDLQQDRSVVKKLLEAGLDVYLIDWGYPRRGDRFLTLQDYIERFIGGCVDYLKGRFGRDDVNLLGVCQGGTFSAIYSALQPDDVKNLALLVAPIDFDTRDGLLNIWSKAIDVDKMVDTLGNIPGDFMNLGFLMLNPWRLMFDKYVTFLEHVDTEGFVSNFIRMEKWIFDSPDQAGEAFRQFIKDAYHENKLIKGEMKIGERRVDLNNVTMPVLNIYAKNDHLVPPASSQVVADVVGSKDVTTECFPTGHIGMFTSGRSQSEYAPAIADWFVERSKSRRGKKKTGGAATRRKRNDSRSKGAALRRNRRR